jgi:hypothetical protein
MNSRAELTKPRGSVAVIVAAALTVLLTVAAFAVDLGNVFVSRNELQNSADAGALAGAARLANADGTLAWQASVSVATSTAERNQSATGVTPFVQATSGYWNLDSGVLLPPGGTVTDRDFPGVEVTSLRSQARENAVPSFFAKMIGVDFFNVEARSIAIISGPGYVEQRDLFPFVVSRCLYENYWDYTRSPPGPKLGSDGKPVVFRLPSTNDPSCGGNNIAWTGLGDGTNANAVKTLVDNYKVPGVYTPKYYALGDGVSVWKEKVAAAVYSEIVKCSPAPDGNGRCKDVTVVVVNNIPTSGDGQQRIIQAFACLTVVKASDKSDKYVDVRMSADCPPPPSAGGIGPVFGTYTPPALVQ